MITMPIVNPAGFIGPNGTIGDRGEVGEDGPKGMMGDVGDVGPMGQKGGKGVRGVMGEMGNMGEKGDQGLPGPDGEKGPPGCSTVSQREYFSGGVKLQTNFFVPQATLLRSEVMTGIPAPSVGSVGFVRGTRSLCIFTPAGWVTVQVGP